MATLAGVSSWRATTVLAYTCLIVAGFIAGIAGSFFQVVMIEVGPVPVPIGLAGMLGATGAVFFAGAWLDSRPIGVGLPALAWFLGVFPFTLERPEGDLVLRGDLRSYGYLILGAGLAAVAALSPGRGDLGSSRETSSAASRDGAHDSGESPDLGFLSRESRGSAGHKTVGSEQGT